MKICILTLGCKVNQYESDSLTFALEKLGREKFEKDGADDIGEGPVYIRRSDAEEMLLAKAKEAKGE